MATKPDTKQPRFQHWLSIAGFWVVFVFVFLTVACTLRYVVIPWAEDNFSWDGSLGTPMPSSRR